jgi:toxin ParE1/3/4
MPNFRLSKQAKADLKSIALYTDHEWGRRQSNHYLLQLDQCFHFLGDNPDIGRACDEIRPGYRYHPQGSHIIFYRLSNNGVAEIIRILHKRMLPTAHL